MIEMYVQIIHSMLMLILSGIGFYCAVKMNSGYPFWVRLIVLSPALAGLGVLGAMTQGAHQAFNGAIAFELSACLLYALVASRFSECPWLDLRTNKTTGRRI